MLDFVVLLSFTYLHGWVLKNYVSMYVCKWLGKIARYKAEHTHEMTLPISQQHAITQSLTRFESFDPRRAFVLKLYVA